ncbi:MAG TPA: SDR family NAD(P)-dependent oxidoreductase, partial [Pedomonas sp.]|nr:SDR family NAD(P)-dependent oxidoreductase [Pedomonas sp.]
MSLFKLEGLRALVTGASGGLGSAIAEALAAQGARVALSGTRKEALEAVAARLPNDPVILPCNLSDAEAVEGLVPAAIEALGGLDIVVNNAGNLRDRMFFRMSEDEWRAVIDVHLNGTFFVSRAAAPHFKAQQSGAYVHMTSTSGLIGNLGQCNYAAAKLGIVALSKSIALDMQRHGVRSNCI